MAKVSIITDAAGVVVDISSNKANLSRGFTFPGYKEYADIEPPGDIRIGDYFDGENVTPNIEERAAQAEKAANEAKIQRHMRDLAIKELKKEGQLPPDYE